MFKVKTLAATAVAALVTASAASATTISIATFTDAAFADYQAGNVLAYEDFEGYTAPAQYAGGLAGMNTSAVGDFTTLGGTGAGGSIIGDGTDLAVDNNTSFGRANTTPGGFNWLSSNDTSGILWEASAGGSVFNSVAFSLTDITDTGATLTVSADGASETRSGLGDGNSQWIVITFGAMVSSADITLENVSGAILNDGFGVDDATIAAVPLPAGVALMMTGLGGLAIARRRKAAK